MPLLGGLTIASEREIGKKPEYLLSYKIAKNNDMQYIINNYELKDKYFLLNEDNTFINFEDEIKFIELNKDIDIVTSVPFCSGLSMLNSSVSNNQVKNENMSRGSDAIQNRFMYLTTEFVLKNITPKVFIFENAPAFYTQTGQKVFDNIVEICKQYKYSFTAIKTSTLLHGIPQNRTRSFGIAWKSNTAPIMNYYNRDYPTVVELFKDIPKDALYHNIEEETKRFEDNFFIQYMINRVGENFRDIFEKESSPILACYMSNNEILEDSINFAKENGFDRDVRYLMHVKNKVNMNKGFWDSSPVVIKEYTNAVISKNSFRTIHPIENRFFTLRENMCLMGLPLDFKLTDEKCANTITQNVPVNTAQDMIKEAIKFINGELQMSNHKVIKQNNISQTIEYLDDKPKKSFLGLIK
jgi:site-specific DNA-cytosine methylase